MNRFPSTPSTDLITPPENIAIRYLGKSEVARYLGLKDYWSLCGVTLPPHDAEIDGRRGWLPETIDAWRDARPGKGNWGARGLLA